MADVPTSEVDTYYTSRRGAIKLCMSQDLKSINHILMNILKNQKYEVNGG
jgi:hypothetical protein